MIAVPDTVLDPATVSPASERRVGGTGRRAALILVATAVALQPLLHPTGPGNSSPVDVATVLAVVAVLLWAWRDGARVYMPYVFPVGVITVAGIVASMFGRLPGDGFLAVLQDIFLLGWTAAVATVVARADGLRLTLAVWSRSAVCWSIVLIAASLAHVSALTGVVAREGNRVPFTFGDPNYAALYWVLSLFVMHAAQVPRRKGYRWAGYGLVLWAFVLAESNGGLLELVLGISVIVIGVVARRYGAAAAIALTLSSGLLAAALFVAVPMDKVRSWANDSGQPLLVNSLGRSGDSTAERSLLLNESLTLYARSDVTGIGPSATKSLLAMDRYPYAKEAHDDYLAALTERGPLGLAGVLTLTTVVAYHGSRFVKRVEMSSLRGAIPRPRGILAAIVATATAAAYYEVLHFRFVWVLLAVLAAGYRGMRHADH